MSKPITKSGKFSAGADLRCGANVVVNVAEELVVGDRCVLPDNAYFEGRRVELGDDFYGMSWGHPGMDAPTVHARLQDTELDGCEIPIGRWLEVGRGRIDEEDAVLLVGNRCTFHDGRIDLSARVEVGDDVGLSPEVAIYTHHYWMDPRDGWPQKIAPVQIGDRVIVGYRSVLLAGANVPDDVVIGAQSVVDGKLLSCGGCYAGNPARTRRTLHSRKMGKEQRREFLERLVADYNRSLEWRGYHDHKALLSIGIVYYQSCEFDLGTKQLQGTENRYTDDLRDFLFKRGLRFWTKRPFCKLPRKARVA